ncbi:MAG: hypothetical protein FIA97_08985 [Methylococcaceae bacterium]|nr:hypothetical protein [Methylococcaceae bacterium]
MTQKNLAVAVAALLSLGTALSCPADDREPFSFALIGDQEYDASQTAKFPNLIEDINRDGSIEFVIHDGDIKSGSSPCTDALYFDRLNSFNSFARPLIYLFGDNEWTDCHRPKTGGYDPFERLAKLREIFAPYDVKSSLGQETLRLERQSTEFPENVRWTRSGVVFVGLNVPGSNNGLSTGALYVQQAKDEFERRNAANIAWLKEAFALAGKRHAPGLLVAFQANPWDYIPSSELTGYQEFLGVLEAETVAFGKPVVLIHGDSHYFRIDKPLPAAPFDPAAAFQPLLWENPAPRLENFTRVETFGTVNVHWIKATVDPESPAVFKFEERIVEKNKAPR